MATKTGTSNISVKWSKYGLEAVITVTASKTYRATFSATIEGLSTATDGGLPLVPSASTSATYRITLSDDIGSTYADFVQAYVDGKLKITLEGEDGAASAGALFFNNPEQGGDAFYYGLDSTSLYPSALNIMTERITFEIDDGNGGTLTATIRFRIPPYQLSLSNFLASYEKANVNSSGSETGVVLFTNKEYKTLLENSYSLSSTEIQMLVDLGILYMSSSPNSYQPTITFKNGRIVATSESSCPLCDLDSSSRTVAYDGVTIRPSVYWNGKSTTYNLGHYIFAVNEERVTESFSIYSSSYLYYCYVSDETSSDSKPTVKIWSSTQRTSSSSNAFSYSKPSNAPSYCQLGILMRMGSNFSQRNLAYAAWLGYIYFQVVIQGPGTNVFKTYDAFGTTYSNQCQAYVNSGNYVLPMFFVPSSSLGTDGKTVTLGANSTSYILLMITSYHEFASGQPASPYQWAVRLYKPDGSYESAGTIYMANANTASWFE